MNVDRVHRLASGLRRSRALRRFEPAWRSIQPAWDRLVEHASANRGYLAHINGDPLRVTYRYGARYEKNGYEPAVQAAFTTRIEAGMVVMDVGAHIGFFALAAALRTGEAGRVFAFEPAPETARVLERHVRMNGFDDRIEVVQSVVSDREEEVCFYTNGETMSAAVFPENVDVLSPERFEATAEEHRIRATTLDAFCRGRDITPDRVKIDVEGAELAVLRGGTTILAGETEILCEVHPAALDYLGGSAAEVEALLASDGRRVASVGQPNRLGIYHLLSRR